MPGLVLSLIAFNIVVSIGLGLAPFFIAHSIGALKFGISALVLCSVAGVLIGLLGSFPIAVLFSTIALTCSPERLKSLGEKEPDGIKDVVIFLSVLLVLAGVLVVWAFQVGALG